MITRSSRKFDLMKKCKIARHMGVSVREKYVDKKKNRTSPKMISGE